MNEFVRQVVLCKEGENGDLIKMEAHPIDARDHMKNGWKLFRNDNPKIGLGIDPIETATESDDGGEGTDPPADPPEGADDPSGGDDDGTGDQQTGLPGAVSIAGMTQPAPEKPADKPAGKGKAIPKPTKVADK